MKTLLIVAGLLIAIPAFGQNAKEQLKLLPDVVAEALSKAELNKVIDAAKKALEANEKADARTRAHNAIMKALEEDPTLKSQLMAE